MKLLFLNTEIYYNKKMHNFDCFGTNINLTFRNSDSSKTLIGALLSCIAFGFSIFSVYYFGIDIFSKSKPISRFFKELQYESKILFKDFPLIIQFVNPNNEVIEELDRYLVFRNILYSMTLDKDTGKQNFEMKYMFIEKCDPEKHFFGMYKDFVMDKSNNFPISTSWCLNPRKIQYSNGTIEERDDLYFMNEWGGAHSQWFDAYFDVCTREKYPNKNCKPIEEIKKVFKEVYNQVYFIDKYINLNNHIDPYSMYTYTFASQLVYGTIKWNFFRIKNIEIETDNGYVLEEISNSNSFQLDSIRNDISLDTDRIMALTLESPKVSEKYSRRYVKVQDLVANVGGLIKSIFVLGKFICEFYSARFLYFYVSNKLLTMNGCNYNMNKSEILSLNVSSGKETQITKMNNPGKSKDLKTRKSNISLNTFSRSVNLDSLKLAVNNDNQNLKVMPKLELSFYDYLKATFCMKRSKYKSDQYSLILSFIKKQFDVVYIINMFMKIIKMQKLILNETNSNNKNKNYLNMKTDISSIENKYLNQADDYEINNVDNS